MPIFRNAKRLFLVKGQNAWVQIPAVLLTGSVTVSK